MLHNWFYHARHIVRIKLVRFKFQTKTTSKFRDLKKETLLKFWLFFCCRTRSNKKVVSKQSTTQNKSIIKNTYSTYMFRFMCPSYNHTISFIILQFSQSKVLTVVILLFSLFIASRACLCSRSKFCQIIMIQLFADFIN